MKSAKKMAAVICMTMTVAASAQGVLAPSAAAEEVEKTVVLGSHFADTGLTREFVDCTMPETVLSGTPKFQNRLDDQSPLGSHAATWQESATRAGVGVLAAVTDPAQISDLSISVRAIADPVDGAAVVRWQPLGLETSWIGVASFPADADTAWHSVQAADLVFSWSEITDDGRKITEGSRQTIADFFVGRDDSAGARAGFAFGCNDAPFVVDSFSVASPTTSRAYDFEAPPSEVSLRLSDRDIKYGRTTRGLTTTRTNARVDSLAAVIERRTTDGPLKVMSLRVEVGKDRWNFTPKQSGAYRVHVLDQDDATGTVSNWISVTVRQRVKAQPSTRSVQRGRQFTISGAVKPGEGTRVVVQRLSTSGWKSVASKATSGSRFALNVRADVVGSIRYRVLAQRTVQNDVGVSRPFTVTVTSPPSGGGGEGGTGGAGTGGGDGDGDGGGGGGGEEPPSGPQRATR